MHIAGGDEPEDQDCEDGAVRPGGVAAPLPSAALGHFSRGDSNVLAADPHDHRLPGLLHPFSCKDRA